MRGYLTDRSPGHKVTFGNVLYRGIHFSLFHPFLREQGDVIYIYHRRFPVHQEDSAVRVQSKGTEDVGHIHSPHFSKPPHVCPGHRRFW